MKLLIAILILISSALSHAEVIMESSRDYAPGEKKPFSLDWSKELELCVKIPGADRNSLKPQCSKKRGGCLRLSDETNNRSYGYNRHIITVNYDKIDSGKLKFTILNEFDSIQRIDIVAFNPNFRLNSNFELSSGEVKEFKIESENDLSVFAEIPIKNTNPLYEACKPKKDCLKVKYYNTTFNSWHWVASIAGAGRVFSPNERGEIIFRVVNDYPIAVNIRATVADIKPKTCEW